VDGVLCCLQIYSGCPCDVSHGPGIAWCSLGGLVVAEFVDLLSWFPLDDKTWCGG